MKILCITESIGPGGAERQLTGLAIMLKKSGYEVVVITYYRNEFYKPLLIENGLEYYCNEKALSKIRRLPELSKVISQEAPDIVISYLDGPNFASCLLRLFGQKYKLIVSERNINQNPRLTIRDKIKFSLYKQADYIVSNSNFQTDYIHEHCPKLNSKLHTITNFTDTNVFCPPKEPLNGDSIICICVGRVVPQKNVHRFIKAISLLKTAGYLLEIRWFGNIDFSDEYCVKCLELIRINNLQEKFHFVEPTNTIHEEYQKANLFCLPSLHEGYPNVLCEAMSSGLPVICSNISDNPMLIESGINGFLFNPKEENDIVNSFLRFISLSKLEKEQMGIVNRNRAIKVFSKEVFLNKYINLIQSFA